MVEDFEEKISLIMVLNFLYQQKPDTNLTAGTLKKTMAVRLMG